MNDKAPNLDLEFQEATQAPESTPVTPEATDVPEKYKGKSVFDLIDMHRNAEKVISRQGQEVSELRRLSDSILGLKQENAKAPETPPTPVTADEVFTDPNTAIEKVLRSSDVTKKTENLAERLDSLERGIGQKEFESRHPSFMKDVNDEQFLEWVQSNRARRDLLAKLHYQYDFSAGNDLWDMWEEQRTSQKPGKPDKSDVIRAAKTVKSGPADTSSKPVYSRAKLLSLQERAMKGDQEARLKWNDPAFQSEYLSAYAEGRIR